jgi:hypothetical protein
MMRRALLPQVALVDARRFLRTTTLADTLKPIPGMSAGTLSVMNEVCVNPDADEERKRPVFRYEVFPKKPEHHWLATLWKWGYNSLTLYKKVNEDPGPWWNANCSTNTSNWAHCGDYAAAGLWSGVWRYTYGVGYYNLRPGECLERGFGRRDKAGALHVDYQETIKEKTQLLMMPHTKEHEQHKRFKNPPLSAQKDIDPVHGKRVMREVQYHLGQGMRMYLVDGVFGSNPATCTPFRVITDNASHAYLASIAAIRNGVHHCYEEVVLCKRLQQSPMDEWAWRRPGVLVLHAPCYDFEVPRIVEEFGGPRPQDLSLATPKFTLLDPYAIPMKGVIGGDPSVETLLNTVAFLAARWGFYADGKNFLTLPGDSIANKDGTLTLVVSTDAKSTEALRSSPRLFGSRQHRIAGGLVSRGFDVTNVSAAAEKPRELDYVEESTKTIFRPLTTAYGVPDAVSHRFFNRRHVGEFGYKLPHTRPSLSAEQKAASAGMLFGGKVRQPEPRASAMSLRKTKIVVVADGVAKNAPAADVAKAIVDSLSKNSWLYAEPAALTPVIAQTLDAAASIEVISSAEVPAYAASLAKTAA